MKSELRKVTFGLAAILMSGALFTTSCGDGKGKTDSSQGDELKGSISISGAWALYPMAISWRDEFVKLHPGVRIDISAGGAGKGMADVLSGMVDLCMFSREVHDEEIRRGAWWIAVTRDAVVPTINAKNPVMAEISKKGLKKSDFMNLYLREQKWTWGQFAGIKNADKINIYTRSDACGAAEMWAKYLGANQEDLKGIGVFGDPGIADAVKNDKLGIGYNNVNFAYDMKTRLPYPNLVILPIDQNENGVIDEDEKVYKTLDDIIKAIKEGKYPSPPARDLYFVSKGAPTNKVVIAFLEWILTEGQQYVDQAGYVELNEEQINAELQRLK